MSRRYAATSLITGMAAIVAGGLASAMVMPLHWELGSWVAAYLVLVLGIVQCAFAAARHYFVDRGNSFAIFWSCYFGWNAGNLLVVGGTLSSQLWILGVGSLAVVVVLCLELWRVRNVRVAAQGALWGYRALLVLVMSSVPVGVVLAAVS